MVKLVRLTSNDNGKFNADLDAGISVGENTQIAVQNLTAQTIFETLNISHANREITSNLNDVTFVNVSSNLTSKGYNSDNQTEFFTDLEITLNDTMRVSGNSGASFVDAGDVYRAIRVDYPNKTPISNDKVELEMRYTPLIMPFFMNEDLDHRILDSIIFYSTDEIEIDDKDGGALDEDLGNMKLSVGTTATAERKYYISTTAEDIFLSRGSGMWGCRVQNLIDNGGASNTNGFAIGLSFTRILAGSGEIPNTSRDFEIRCQKVADNYVFITPTVPYAEQDTGLAPYSMISVGGGGGVNNDQMVFIKDGANLHLQIWNRNGAANGQIAWEVVYTLSKEEQAKPLYPYLYICGSSVGDTTNDNIVGQPYFTADPFMTGNNEFEVTGEVQTLNNTQYNLMGWLGVSMNQAIPVLENDRFDTVDLTQNYLWRMSGDVWRHLGVNRATSTGYYDYKPIPRITPTSTGVTEQQLRIQIIAQDIYILVNSDNFIVMLDSNPLICYDASKYDYGSATINADTQNIHRGRRQNILATIPTNDNNGIIEYNANELVYIDLDNKYPQILKNLRLRILNKNFDEISTTGMSILTLLIK